MVFLALALCVLLIIVYDDLKYRSVRVFLFPVLAALLLYSNSQKNVLSDIAINAAFNISYVAIVFAICYAYLWMRNKGSLTSFIGTGDFLLLLCLAFWFEPIEFILFNTLSFSAALLAHLILTRIVKSYRRLETIPLAGYQSLFFVFVLIAFML